MIAFGHQFSVPSPRTLALALALALTSGSMIEGGDDSRGLVREFACCEIGTSRSLAPQPRLHLLKLGSSIRALVDS